jgi:NTP pyrophosphatase (non-canonical NTP hydrolase)
VDVDRLSDEVEVVSQIYALRYGIERDPTWFLLKLQEEVGELTQAILMLSGGSRGRGNTPEQLQQALRTELADVLSQVLLLTRHHDVDLQAAVEEKWLRRNPDWMLRQTNDENR